MDSFFTDHFAVLCRDKEWVLCFEIDAFQLHVDLIATVNTRCMRKHHEKNRNIDILPTKTANAICIKEQNGAGEQVRSVDPDHDAVKTLETEFAPGPFQVKQPRLQWKFYSQCKSPASSIIFYGISNVAVVNQNSSFTDGNLKRKVDLDLRACKISYTFAVIYFICKMAASFTLTESTV
ncbi:hypothetical protein EJB05_33365, partial [Eragrostis curvula]